MKTLSNSAGIEKYWAIIFNPARDRKIPFPSLGHSHPWLYTSPYFEKYQDEYVAKLFRASTHGEWTEWISFCLVGVIEQSEDSIRRCHAFNALRQDYRQRLANLGRVSKRTHELVERLFENEIVTIGDVAEMFDVTPPTARADIDRLVAADVLRPLKRPRIKPQYFIAHDIARIAYVD